MHKLSLFFGLIVSVVPSLALPILLAPFYQYKGPVVPGRYIIKVRDNADQASVIGLINNLAGTNTVSRQYTSDFYNAFVGSSICLCTCVIIGP
jgi:hypothetical protein